ncbi:MAG TPA: fatty acid desaturase CarF family protein [Bryobacteraceae bacterium]|nr:fatty acid desaturase CarF family protein [Bryobacteraceae bacterium]
MAVCLATQALAVYGIATRQQRNAWLCILAFFIGGFVTDFISGLFHFSFDYVWPPRTPIMGPIAVEFQEHHVEPTLDPSALSTNLTKGAYGALPLALITILVTRLTADTAFSFLLVASLMATSLWMLGFHQIHAYAHMGSELGPDEFNRAVTVISQLSPREQKKEFAKLFEALVPRWVRVLQRCRLFLRPEIHWQHHISFETDFSSVNGWSDPVTNGVYRAIVRRIRAKKVAAAAALAAEEKSVA